MRMMEQYLPNRNIVRIQPDQHGNCSAQYPTHNKPSMNVGGWIFWGHLLGQHLGMMSTCRPKAKDNSWWIN